MLINATRFESGSASTNPFRSAGDYSLVVLRKLIDGKVATIPIAANYFAQAQPDIQSGVEYSLRSILDLNGDGQMEIVVDSNAWGWSGTAVYEVVGPSVQLRLEAGCGV